MWGAELNLQNGRLYSLGHTSVWTCSGNWRDMWRNHHACCLMLAIHIKGPEVPSWPLWWAFSLPLVTVNCTSAHWADMPIPSFVVAYDVALTCLSPVCKVHTCEDFVNCTSGLPRLLSTLINLLFLLPLSYGSRLPIFSAVLSSLSAHELPSVQSSAVFNCVFLLRTQ